MTRHTFTTSLLGLMAALAVTTTAATAQSGVAYVAVTAVLQQTPGYAKADSTWNIELAGYKRQMNELQAKLDSASAAFDQSSVMLSPSNRAAERKKLEAQATQMQQQVNDIQQQALNRQHQILDPIQKKVLAVVESLRVEGNYSMVFDVSSQGGSIVTADTTLDLTRKAIARLKGTSGPTGSSGND